ncbi:MAG: hypothetical protein AAGA97_02605 [Pseudomonadota bacterium]
MTEARNTKYRTPNGYEEGCAAFYLFRPEKDKTRSYDTIDLKFKNGERRGLDYSMLHDRHYNPANGALTLEFLGKEVTLYGWALEELYECILTKEVAQIVEHHDNEINAPESKPFIQRIEYRVMN